MEILVNSRSGYFNDIGGMGGPDQPTIAKDVDRDGAVDLVCGALEWSGPWSGLQIQWGSNHEWTAASLDYDGWGLTPIDGAAEDIDGDGLIDLLACGYTYVSGSRIEGRICWVRGTGPRAFETTIHHFSLPDAKVTDIALAPLTGGPHLDAIATFHYPWGDSTKVLLYDAAHRQFVVSRTLPAGKPLLKRINADATWDLVLSDTAPSPSALVEMGTGGGAFSLVQTLNPVRGAAFGRILGIEEKDLITVGDDPPQIAVRRYDPGQVDVPDLEQGTTVASLSIRPSVTSSSAEIAWAGAKNGPVIVRVVDVSGRTVGMYNAPGPSWRWDLRDGSGSRVAPGIYWIAMADAGGRVAYGKLVVVH